ncbi:MAG: ATP-binding cassette domain-containing protein, partial [Deltaproteobacteria bacterium]
MLLAARNLTKTYRVPGAFFWEPTRTLKALDDVSLSIAAGETVGILGASGSGKTTLAHILCRVLSPTSGRLDYGPAIADPRRDIQLIAQNPYAAFDPLLTIGASLEEPLLIHGMRR